MCYNCYADQRNPPRSKEVHNNEEARIQTEFFKLIPLYFPNIPDKLIFAVLHIPADTRSAFPVISVHSPVSIQYRWQS